MSPAAMVISTRRIPMAIRLYFIFSLILNRFYGGFKRKFDSSGFFQSFGNADDSSGDMVAEPDDEPVVVGPQIHFDQVSLFDPVFFRVDSIECQIRRWYSFLYRLALSAQLIRSVNMI